MQAGTQSVAGKLEIIDVLMGFIVLYSRTTVIWLAEKVGTIAVSLKIIVSVGSHFPIKKCLSISLRPSVVVVLILLYSHGRQESYEYSILTLKKKT